MRSYTSVETEFKKLKFELVEGCGNRHSNTVQNYF
jgi:hypothetical protein